MGEHLGSGVLAKAIGLDDLLARFIMQAPTAICLLLGPSHVYTVVNARYQALFPNKLLLGLSLRGAFPELVGRMTGASKALPFWPSR